VTAPPSVRVLDAEPNGLASTIAGLLRANLAAHPERAGMLRPGAVEIVAIDAGVSVIVRSSAEGVEVANGDPAGSGRADLTIRASANDLLALTACPLRAGLPDPLQPAGREILGKLLRGRIRVRGLLTNAPLLTSFAALLSIG
jgi:hypothetical protein